MADIDLKTETPDTTLPTTGFLFGADSQAAASPSVFTVQSVATTLLGSTTLTGATITTSQPVIDAAQTWNASGVTFTGLKFNATDTASAADSLLMDLQVGGSSRFNVGKTGSLKLGVSPTGTNQAGTNVTISGSQGTGTGAGGSIIFQVAPAGSTGTAQNALATALTIGSDQSVTLATTGSMQGISVGTSGTAASSQIRLFDGSASLKILGRTSAFELASDVLFGWRNNTNVTSGTADTILARDDANKLALRNGVNAQAFRVYNTFTSATNFEAFKIDWITTANTVLVGTEKGSAGGTAREMALLSQGTTFNFRSGGTGSIGIGPGAYNSTATGINNTCIGDGAGDAITTGQGNTAVGRDTLGSVAGGNSNTCVGYQNHQNGTSFSNNTAVGFQAGKFITGNDNTSLGAAALSGNGAAARNTVIGYSAITSGTGNNNVAVGYQAGNSFTTAANNTLLGYDTDTNAATDSNSIVIGYQAVGIGSNTTVIGNSSTTNIEIFGRLQFDGTTSSFPALKRSSASLIVRLADDTANAALESASLKTDAPAGGTAATWKLGVRVAATTLLDTTQYIEVDVGGTLYKLAVVTT